jgi:hypothetical protein
MLPGGAVDARILATGILVLSSRAIGAIALADRALKLAGAALNASGLAV